MPTPATYTVTDTAVYRSLDGKDSRKFKTGAVIDYGEAVRFGMVAAPDPLPPLYGWVRFNPANFSVDDDAVVSVTGGLAVSPGFVYALANPSDSSAGAVAWKSTGDVTLDGSVNDALELWLDLSGVTQVRLVGRIVFAGGSGATLGFRYSLDGDTFADELTSPQLAMPFDATGWQDSGWQDIVTGARQSVYLRPWGANGDGATNGGADPLYLQFK